MKKEKVKEVNPETTVYTDVYTDGEVYLIYLISNLISEVGVQARKVRVLKLIQKARESQDGFVPDWDDEGQDKCVLYFCMGDFGVAAYLSVNVAPIFGYWEERSVCKQFIDENSDELRWFFTEYRG